MKRVLSLILALVLLAGIMSVAVSAATKPVPGYYVVGTMNNWSLDPEYLMQEYSGSLMLYPVSLTTEDEFKIVYSSDGISKTIWYPSGVDNNITVDYDSDWYALSITPAGLGIPEEWGGFYFLADVCTPPDGIYPTEPEPEDTFKKLWESGAKLTAEDIEEAVNEKFHTQKWIYADEIELSNSYRFSCTPAYIVDFEVEGYGYYLAVIQNVRLGDYLFYSVSSYEPSIFIDGSLYSLTRAYEAGLLTDDMLAELVAADYKGGGRGNRCRIISRYVSGDADGDGEVSITDATVIQRYDVDIIGSGDLYKPLADVDGDNDVTIVDATLIQRYEAGIIETI